MSGRITVVKVDGGPLWALGSTYFSKALITASKAVPGIIWNDPDKTWRGYPDAVSAVCARLSAGGLRVDGAKELPFPDSWRHNPTPFLFARDGLRDYQIEGVRFLIARAGEGALLADGMRIGKSCQALTAARAFKQKTLIICPSHVVGVWARPKDAVEGPGEIAKWWPDAWRATPSVKNPAPIDFQVASPGVLCLESVKPAKYSEALVQDTAEEMAHVNVIVCHYEIVYAWVEVLIAWGISTLIIDEGHILSGFQAIRTKAIKRLRTVSKRCIVLTGTPVVNNPAKTHNLLDIIAPGRFGYFSKGYDLQTGIFKSGSYAGTFCGSRLETVGKGEGMKTVPKHDGKTNLDEPDGVLCLTRQETLKERLKFMMLRRLAKDVDKELPIKTRMIVDVQIPPKKIIRVSGGMLTSDGRELRRCLDLAADGKLKSVVELAASHVNEGESIIVGCFRRRFAEEVAAGVLKKVGEDARVDFVHGGLLPKERDARIHQLRVWANGAVCLAGTIDTISTGINLSFAGGIIVAELTWDAFEVEQLEERIYAVGKGGKSWVKYVVARGTGDELVVRGVINKLDTADKIIGETKSGLKEDLAKRRENSLARLAAAMKEMQRAR